MCVCWNDFMQVDGLTIGTGEFVMLVRAGMGLWSTAIAKLLLVASAARLRLRRTCRAALERQALNLLSRRRHGASAPVRTFAPCDSPMGARQAFSMLDVLCLRVFLMGITAKHLGLKKRVFLCPRLNRSNRLNNVLRALVSSPGELNPSGAVFKNAQFLQED